MKEIIENKSTFKMLLEMEVFSVDKYSLTVYKLLGALLIIIIGLLVNRLIKKVIYKSAKLDLGKKFALSRMIYYVLLIVIFFFTMSNLGIDISPLLFGSGALLVGLGLGLQNLFLDFISGIIILLDGSVEVGDVVEVDGTIGKVDKIKMRTTQIITRDNKSIIYANSILTKDKLINYSHNDETVRFSVSVGVHYNTDIQLAERLMIEAANQNKYVLTKKQPIVRLEEFGDSSLNLSLYFYSESLFKAPQMLSDLRKSILNKFRTNDINIPYPIRTLDFPKEYYENKTTSYTLDNHK